ncbi:MAG: hypothetical protein ACUVRS_09055 [Armatimonadota bacterium]
MDKICRVGILRSKVVLLTCGLVIVLIPSLPGFAAPSVTNISLSADSVGRYEIIELRASIVTVAQNSFWPYDPAPPPPIPPRVGITVDGLFSDDEWNTSITVPGFLFLDYERKDTPSGEAFIPVGKPEWRVRFAPPRLGTWRARLRVTDASGTVTSPESDDLVFQCIESQNHGFVRVSATDPRYFELSDGTPLLGPGINTDFRSVSDAESKLDTFGDNGIRIVRWWMNYRGWQNPFGGGDVATAGGPQWSFSLSMDTGGGCKPGDRYSAKLLPGRDTRQSAYLIAGRTYKFSGYIKVFEVAGSAEQGVVPYIGNEQGGVFTGTSDWTPFEIRHTPNSDIWVSVGVKHTGSEGTGYFDDLELRYSTDGGQTWSENCLVKWDIDFQNYIDLQEAYKVDLIFSLAKQSGVYLKTVIAEKQDKSLGCIGLDGTTVERSDNNFYASANHPSRWLQKAWWRYLTARWGCYTSRHSWELCNEGDPFNEYHWDAANALADYIHSIDPNRAMCTTSFWHSIPMEFWKNSSCDYIDLHEYYGPKVAGTESHGPRFHAWYDPPTFANNTCMVPITSDRGEILLDTSVIKSGNRSLKLIAYENPNAGASDVITEEYHVGVDPAHTYRFRVWARGENISNPGGDLQWSRPGVGGVWSRAYHENDFIGFMPGISFPLGTFEGKFFESASFKPPATANTANIVISCPRGLPGVGNGILWVDQLEFIDETTGENLFVDGGFEMDRIDYDVALAVQKYGVLLNSYGRRIGKPVMWAETGIRGLNMYGNPYKGFYYTGESQEVIDDTECIHIRKFVWAHIAPMSPNALLWFAQMLHAKGVWYYFRAFQDFMSDIPLSNGQYRDVQADTTNSNIRVLGQKDPVNNRAHIWIDNALYTWKAVVDHSYRPEPWSSSVTYAKDSTCGAGNPTHIYKSLQDNNKNHPVTDTEWWQDMGEFNPANNPSLPPPVSGDVIISGLANGVYQVEWWNTSTGLVIRTERVECKNGKITLTVENLVSDIACKLAPAPPDLSLRLTVIEGRIAPGSEVTIAVDFTNVGNTDALNAGITARVPAEMDYVVGSAEVTGGIYNPAEKTITWIVDRIAPGETGRRLFKAIVR